MREITHCYNNNPKWETNTLILSIKYSKIIFCILRDNDRSSLNCASMLKGGWWWKSCGRGLNGLYLNDPQDLTARQGKKQYVHTRKNHKSKSISKHRSFCYRNSLVQMERLGLHTEEGQYDDQTSRECTEFVIYKLPTRWLQKTKVILRK